MRLLFVMSFLLSSSVMGKVVINKDQLFLETKGGGRTPISNLNTMLDKREIKNLKLYGEGSAHIVSFAKEKGKEKNYSIDHRGYIYDIEPFSNYTVSKVYKNGDVEFKEVPGRRYKVTSEGYYIY